MNWHYPLIMLIAVGLGAILIRRSQAKLTLNPREKFAISLGAFCGAMIGAKLPFVISDWQGLLSGAAWFSNGKTILCGLVGGYFGVELAKWSCNIRTKTGDTFAIPVAVAVGCGRIACFVAGCCYGTPTSLPWGVRFNAVDNLARHPTQIYEAGFHFVAAAFLAQFRREGRFRGQLIKLYILAYLVFRFVSETIRPEARLAGGLTGYQWGCLLLAPLFLWLWHRDARSMTQVRPQEGVSEPLPPDAGRAGASATLPR